MSAWLVSDAHIDALIDGAHQAGDGLVWEHNGTTHHIASVAPDRLGRMLQTENRASIAARYRDQPAQPADHTYQGDPAQPVIWEAIHMLARCYDYQTCEHAGWEGSELRAFTDALETAALYEGQIVEKRNAGTRWWGITDHAEYRQAAS